MFTIKGTSTHLSPVPCHRKTPPLGVPEDGSYMVQGTLGDMPVEGRMDRGTILPCPCVHARFLYVNGCPVDQRMCRLANRLVERRVGMDGVHHALAGGLVA